MRPYQPILMIKLPPSPWPSSHTWAFQGVFCPPTLDTGSDRATSSRTCIYSVLIELYPQVPFPPSAGEQEAIYMSRVRAWRPVTSARTIVLDIHSFHSCTVDSHRPTAVAHLMAATPPHGYGPYLRARTGTSHIPVDHVAHVQTILGDRRHLEMATPSWWMTHTYCKTTLNTLYKI